MRTQLKDLLVPTSPLDFWTMILALGTLLVAFVAYKGLRSLGLMKSDMLTRATRNARECAIQRCEEFATKIIPANAAILKAFGTNRIPMFVKGAEQVGFDPDNDKDLQSATAWRKILPEPLQIQCIRFLNDLEAWSMYFIAGVADHETAFRPCATPFCSMIVENYGMLLVLRSGGKGLVSGRYPNATELYKLWLPILEKEKLGLKAGDLLRQLSELQAQRAPPLPRPLGTDID